MNKSSRLWCVAREDEQVDIVVESGLMGTSWVSLRDAGLAELDIWLSGSSS